MIDPSTDYHRGYRIYRVSDGWRYEHLACDWYDATDGRHGFAETYRQAIRDINWREDAPPRWRRSAPLSDDWAAYRVVAVAILVAISVVGYAFAISWL